MTQQRGRGAERSEAGEAGPSRRNGHFQGKLRKVCFFLRTVVSSRPSLPLSLRVWARLRVYICSVRVDSDHRGFEFHTNTSALPAFFQYLLITSFSRRSVWNLSGMGICRETFG